MKKYKDIRGDGGSDITGQVTAQARKLSQRLASVKHIVAVMSGKGGVGKSSVTVNVAAALAMEGHAVGIVDADINGASIAKMTGVRGQPLQISAGGVQPAVAKLGIKVMSIDLFLPAENRPVVWDAPTQKDAFTWRGMAEANAIREFFADTEWGGLDFLLIDLPPGTDKLPNMMDLLPKISGTVIVTIPAGLSQFVVEKSIKMAREVLQTPVTGLVENMSTFICPHCGKAEDLFPGGGVEKLAMQHGIPFLGKIPFDHRLARSADVGQLYLTQRGDLPAESAIREIAAKIIQYLQQSA